MTRTLTALAAAGLLLGSSTGAYGQAVAVRTARLGADDVEKTAAFYKASFGLQEILRYERPEFKEIILNFGSDVQAAKANGGPRIALISRPKDTVDRVSHLILNVEDMDDAVRKVRAAGGSVEKEPKTSASSGNVISMIVDPAGNRVELIMAPSRPRP